MSGWRRYVSMSRHERTGALVVLAFVAVTLAALWGVSTCSSPLTTTDAEALRRFGERVDSLQAAEAQNDSLRRAERAAKAAAKQKRDTTGAKRSHGSTGKGNKGKSKPKPLPKKHYDDPTKKTVPHI